MHLDSFRSLVMGAALVRGAFGVAFKRQPEVTLETFQDYYPDFDNGYGPEPPLENEDGTPIELENVRGTRIFGGAGCDGNDWSIIKESWHDMNKIVSTDGVKSNIDWNSQPAKEFWGPPSSIPQERKDFIQKKYENAEQMWSYWWAWEPPWLSWRRLYINVTCSGGDGSGDPENRCGDRQPDDDPGRCPPDRNGNPGRPIQDGQDKMQAYTTSEPKGESYTKVTFCNAFFDLRSLGEAVSFAKKQSPAVQDNLEIWDNRARVWMHEVTHMNYFMETPPKGSGPWVRDLTVNVRGMGDVSAYGPYLAKVMRNWNKNPGYYTQMNADTYAWYAMGKYAQTQINRFPPGPRAGSKAPTRAPRDENNDSLNSIDPTIEQGDENSPDPEVQDEAEMEWEEQRAPDFKVPGCPDTFDIGAAEPQPPAGAQCDTNERTDIPHNVFSGQKGDLFAPFCKDLDTTKEKKMTVNSKGEDVNKRKRAPPPNPDTWSEYRFEFLFKPDDGECRRTCEEAFRNIHGSHCGQQVMATKASINAGCGEYSYVITKTEESEEQPEEEEEDNHQDLVLGERECFPEDAFGGKDADDGYLPMYIGYACAGSALPESNVKKGDQASFRNFHTKMNGVPYTFNVYWEDGCETSVDEVNMFVPLPDSNEDQLNCMTFMRENYEKCKDKNGGKGGKIQAGCVVYEFKTEDQE